jgi:hypothetical protein
MPSRWRDAPASNGGTKRLLRAEIRAILLSGA